MNCEFIPYTSFFIPKKLKLGICLSGGGARGIAHIGVLKALEEHNIFPQFVSGASAGSIVGSLYAAGKSIDEIIGIIHGANIFKIFTFSTLGLASGLANMNYLRKILSHELQTHDFETLPSKLFVCVSNINKGKWSIIKNGNIINAVIASSSIPLIFEPVEINGELYVDGGLLNNFPVEPLLVECDMIIGVNVMPNAVKRNISGLRTIAERCVDLVVWSNTEIRASKCNVLIDVNGVEEFGFFDFQKAEAIIELGYHETLKLIPKIKKRIEELKSN